MKNCIYYHRVSEVSWSEFWTHVFKEQVGVVEHRAQTAATGVQTQRLPNPILPLPDIVLITKDIEDVMDLIHI